MPIKERRGLEPAWINVEHVHVKIEVPEHSSDLALNRLFLPDGARNTNEILEHPDAWRFKTFERVVDRCFGADGAH
jgi:hypothetical protein